MSPRCAFPNFRIIKFLQEIDNFHPERFQYKNILLYDLESSNLLDHWETTFRFIGESPLGKSIEL